MDLVDGLEMSVVFELPDHFLITSDLEELRLFANMTMAKIVAEDRVSIGKALASRHQPEGIARKIQLLDVKGDVTRGEILR